MAYIKCPKCDGLNYMDENDELCAVCSSQFNFSRPSMSKKKIETDFTKILRGRVYGGNSRKIYEKFCDTLKWDKWKADQFGWQTPLYAKNADTDRKRDVWFIFHANYDPEHLDSVVDDAHVINLITDDGERIIEVVDERLGKTNPADRITFVKTNSGYEFFGIYTIMENGTTRVYRRIADNYPIE